MNAKRSGLASVQNTGAINQSSIFCILVENVRLYRENWLRISGRPGHQPYTVNFIFSLGAAASALPMIYLLMRKPISGPPLHWRDYVSGRWNAHAWGMAGGLIWGVGTIANFVASYVPMIGPATSFSMGEGNTMISALWEVFVWKEFRGAGTRVRLYLVLMFLFFFLGLTSIALSPVIK